MIQINQGQKIQIDKQKASYQKKEQLSRLTVETSTGKVFYADPESRTDLDGAVLQGLLLGATDEMTQGWKTKSRPQGTNQELVTFAEMKEASRLALEAKGQIVGVE